MAIEDLHDFPTLQIPQVDFAIFAARHDPLASGDAEAGADAVLGVLVADVRLQAARRLEVPETYGTVVGGGEDVFRVGRKLHVLAVEVNRFLFFLLFIFEQVVVGREYGLHLVPDGIVSLREGLDALSGW